MIPLQMPDAGELDEVMVEVEQDDEERRVRSRVSRETALVSARAPPDQQLVQHLLSPRAGVANGPAAHEPFCSADDLSGDISRVMSESMHDADLRMQLYEQRINEEYMCRMRQS